MNNQPAPSSFMDHQAEQDENSKQSQNSRQYTVYLTVSLCMVECQLDVNDSLNHSLTTLKAKVSPKNSLFLPG